MIEKNNLIILNEKDFHLRLISKNDKEEYFYKCIKPSDSEVNYFTGSRNDFDQKTINTYIDKIVEDNSRYDFMIIEDGSIIGEVVINEIDWTLLKAHYRIALFSKVNFNKGIGFRASKLALDFVLNELGLKEISLEVYPFNKRGIHVYDKLGFKQKNTIFDKEEKRKEYREFIIMTLKNS